MSKEAASFFQQWQNKMVGSLNTCAIGEIQTFDTTKLKADVKLLPDGDLIKSVPVAMPQTNDFIIRVPYQPGDKVVVVFSQRDIDPIMYGESQSSGRMLAIDDAIVVGGINLFSISLPSDNPNDLVIAKKDFTAKIIIGDDGIVTVDAPKGISLKANDPSGQGVSIQGKTSSQSW